jgi:hypothetical protein
MDAVLQRFGCAKHKPAQDFSAVLGEMNQLAADKRSCCWVRYLQKQEVRSMKYEVRSMKSLLFQNPEFVQISFELASFLLLISYLLLPAPYLLLLVLNNLNVCYCT